MLLELRYMDDVIGFWKGCAIVPAELVKPITDWLWERLLHRYPLPLERDNSGIFVGLAFDLCVPGQIGVQPSIQRPSSYNSGCHSALMPFCSFVPASVKRGLVLGVAARVETFTEPADMKPMVLAASLRHLHIQCGFPRGLLRKWISSWRPIGLPWVQKTWHYF